MIHYIPNNAETENQLNGALEIIRDPKNWCKGDIQKGDSYCLNGALYAAGMAENPVPDEHASSHPDFTRGDIKRGEMQEPFWFLRLALSMFSDHQNIGQFNDDPATEHHQVIGLICLAIKLVQADDLGIYYEIENAA